MGYRIVLISCLLLCGCAKDSPDANKLSDDEIWRFKNGYCLECDIQKVYKDFKNPIPHPHFKHSFNEDYREEAVKVVERAIKEQKPIILECVKNIDKFSNGLGYGSQGIYSSYHYCQYNWDLWNRNQGNFKGGYAYQYP